MTVPCFSSYFMKFLLQIRLYKRTSIADILENGIRGYFITSIRITVVL